MIKLGTLKSRGGLGETIIRAEKKTLHQGYILIQEQHWKGPVVARKLCWEQTLLDPAFYDFYEELTQSDVD